MKDLASLSSAEFKSFLDSFDTVLCDCDGVIWLLGKTFPGIQESLTKLEECGKRITFVSNNNTIGLEKFVEKFNNFQIGVTSENIVYSTLVIIDYLKSINFDKEILLIGSRAMRNEFKEAGYALADMPGEWTRDLECIEIFLQTSNKIGAVIFDFDVNLSFSMIYKAALYLKRPDVLFIAGATDKKLGPVGPDTFLIGPGYFLDALTEFTGRVPLVFGKPGTYLCKYLDKKLNMTVPSRTLVIGDSLEQDMAFASVCSYQKLLVFTGVTKGPDDVLKCENQSVVPDYYLSSLGEFSRLVKDKLNI